MTAVASNNPAIESYYHSKIRQLQTHIDSKTEELHRLETQRNVLNAKGTYLHLSTLLDTYHAVRELRDELQYLLEPASHIGEVVKPMGRDKVLVKVSSSKV